MIRTSESLVTLGTDQATSSGWCIHVGQSPVRHGVALTAIERKNVVQLAREYALEHSQRNSLSWFIFVFEDHSQFASVNGRGHGTLIGALHRWLEHLDLNGHPPHLRIGVRPSAWQKSVLGVKSAKVNSAERKQQSLLWASHHVRAPITSHDQADAIALSAYGSLEGERLIDLRARKATWWAKPVRR